MRNTYFFNRVFHNETLEIFDIEYSDFYYISAISGDEDDETNRDEPSDGCHYNHHPIGWTIFLSFNFVAMFLIPFLVGFIFQYQILILFLTGKIRVTFTLDVDWQYFTNCVQ